MSRADTMRKNDRRGDIDKISTWTKFQPWLCETCRANCCRMAVEVSLRDLVRMEILTWAKARLPIEDIEKELRQDGVVDHFYIKERSFILARTADGNCRYLDLDSRECSIYKKRPDTCREHPEIGPRPGFCAYEER